MQVKEYKEGSKKLYSCRFWYYKNGVKKSKYKSGFLKKKDAECWGIDEKRKLERLQVDSTKTILNDFLDRWINTKEKKLSPTTLSGYKVNIEHIKRHIGNMNLINLQTIDIQEMADAITDEDKKKKTVQYIIRTLHTALKYAVKNKIIHDNPCKDIEIVDDKEKFNVNTYTAEDLSTLLVKLKEQEHSLYIPVLIAAMRGLRRGECLGLSWNDIDFDKNLMTIRNNYVVVNGQYYHKKVKTKDSDRIASIEGLLSDELKEYKARINKDGNIQTYVCEIDGKLPDPSHLSRQLKSFQKANNLPECRFHDLRHTFAMLQLENGTDLSTLSKMLGHSKIGITSDIYLHQNIAMIKKAGNVIDNVISLKKENCHNNVTIASGDK